MASTIGISVNEREQREIVEAFDDALDCGPDGERSRSDQIKIAMQFWAQVAPKLEEAGIDIDDGRAVRGPARQAVFDYLRDDRSEPVT